MTYAHFPISVHVILLKNKEVLLLLRKNTGYKDGMWALPAGRLDENEKIADGAVREALEEAGITIHPTDLSAPLVMHHKDERGERIHFFFMCERWTGEPRNCEPEKCGGVEWFGLNKLPEKIVEHVRDGIRLSKNKETFTEYGF